MKPIRKTPDKKIVELLNPMENLMSKTLEIKSESTIKEIKDKIVVLIRLSEAFIKLESGKNMNKRLFKALKQLNKI